MTRRRAGLAAVAVLVLLPLYEGAAQEREIPWTCGIQLQLDGLAGTAYVRGLLDGYLEAAELAHKEASQLDSASRKAEEIVSGPDTASEVAELPISTFSAGAQLVAGRIEKEWPEGRTVGELVDRLRAHCQRPGNRERLVREMLLDAFREMQ